MIKPCLLTKLAWILGFSVIGTPVAFAAEPSTDRWFEIEVILFKNNNPNSDSEIWPKQTSIRYPELIEDYFTSRLFPEPEISQVNDSVNDVSEISESIESPNTQAPTKTNENGTTENDDVTFVILENDKFQLVELANSLSKSSQYTKLSHYAWRQTVLDKRHAPWLRVVGGNDLSSTFKHNGNAKNENDLYQQMGINASNYQQNTTQVNNLLSTNELIQNNNSLTVERNSENAKGDQLNPNEVSFENSPSYIPVPEVDGAIQVYLNRYLHITTQLYFREPGQSEVDISSINSDISSNLLKLTDDGVFKTEYDSGFNWNFGSQNFFQQEKNTVMIEKLLDYSLDESRRMKSNEIHYFDHPLFGMIIQIRPYVAEEKSETQTSENENTTGENG